MEKRALFHGVENDQAILPVSARPMEVVNTSSLPFSKIDAVTTNTKGEQMFATPSKPGAGPSKRQVLSELSNNNNVQPVQHSQQPFSQQNAQKAVGSLHVLQHLRPIGSALLTGPKRIVVFQSPQHAVPVPQTPIEKTHKPQDKAEKNHYMKPTEAFK
jgi:hypothetical protein